MSQSSLIKLNISQNYPDFILKSLNKEPLLFKKGYLKKTLNLIQENPEDARTYTIRCLV
jgi:hypothetical protein